MAEVQSASKERRLYARYPCQGSAEVRTLNAHDVHWGTVTDISLGGCYVESPSPVPQGREVRLKLTVAGHIAEVEGRIVVSHPMVGMAVLFTSLNPEARTALRNMISAVSGGKPVMVAPPPVRTVTLTQETALAVVQDISSHFRVNRTLTAQQFAEIVDRLAGKKS